MLVAISTLNPCLQIFHPPDHSQRGELKRIVERIVERIVTLKLFLAGRTAPRDLSSGQEAIVNNSMES
jgi:hypothetical protein